MKKMGLNEIREAFLSFWESKGHYRMPSFPLVPQHDKSLLIINSGMAPLKPYFSGAEVPPSKRVTTCQKCIRTPDLENVGITARHGTFFEMMGNFSFGDYFKRESISWGWEFCTKVLDLPEELLWVTVYENDDEAYDIWAKEVGIPESRIVRLGKEDNFWEIGTGPCGPCSEIYFDRGEAYGCDNPNCAPGCECDRYIEFWNHVFTQFDAQSDGTYAELKQKNIDTGLGLERMACIMQGVDSIFDVDTLAHIINVIEKRCNVKYEGDGFGNFDVSIRIITDHVRSATFMIGDKIMPGNEGRGYVLRRLIRRAARHGRKMGVEDIFLADIVDAVIEVSGEAYPELKEQQLFIKKIISIEEEKFNETLDQGMEIISSYIKDMKANGESILSGEKAFRLHDTNGFPIDITKEILADEGLKVDEESFEELMQKQKQAGKDDAAESDFAWEGDNFAVLNIEPTIFTGYEKTHDFGKVVAIFNDKQKVENAKAGDTVSVIVDKTPFYATGGGQVNDIGIVETSDMIAKVTDVIKHVNIYVHTMTIEKGVISVGNEINLKVDVINRNSISRNHTSTHLLHSALRQVLGTHVQQSGSLVNKDVLRFDFSHYEAMSKNEIAKVEELVNNEILKFDPVNTEVMDIQSAKNAGAIGLFDEKYADEVRVVSVGDFSKELCGGIHVKNSGQIGAFKILSESGIANGVRRIEAVTGMGIVNQLNNSNAIVDEACILVKSTSDQLNEKIAGIIAESKENKKKLKEIMGANLADASTDMIDAAKDVNGIKFIAKKFDGYSIDDLRKISDEIKAKTNNVALVMATVNNPKVTFLVSLTDDMVQKGYHAGKMIKQIAAAAGGGGGGKADMAQAGAKDASKIEEAFKVAENLL